MEWLDMTAMLSIPTLLAVAIVAFGMRGSARWFGMLPLGVLALALALDAYSASGRGNLTGLFTMIAAVPALALLLLIWGVAAALSEHRRVSGEPKPSPATGDILDS